MVCVGVVPCSMGWTDDQEKLVRLLVGHERSEVRQGSGVDCAESQPDDGKPAERRLDAAVAGC
jgi:hypothetical protein